jgi:hypothetical protein
MDKVLPDMKSLINKSTARVFLLSLRKDKTRVAQSAFDKLEAAARQAARDIVEQHDNKTGGRKTIE